MKKFLSLLFALTLLSNFSFAQKGKDSSSVKESKWSVNFSITPTYSYRYYRPINPISIGSFPSYFLKYGLYPTTNVEYIQDINKFEEPYFGWGCGIGFQYKVNKPLSFWAGFSYDDFVYRSVVIDSIYYGDNGTPLILENSRYYYQIKWYHSDIGTKIYFLNNPNFSMFLNLSLSFGDMSETYYLPNSAGQVVSNSSIFDYFSMAPNFNVGGSYKLSNRLALCMEPGFTYILKRIPEYFGYNAINIYSFHLTTSLNISF